MKRADLSNGLFIAGHKTDIVDGRGVVVAQAPSGIHTQLGDVDWKRVAPILANSVKMLQELTRLADIAEDHRENVTEARKLIALAIEQAPELASVLGVEQNPAPSGP